MFMRRLFGLGFLAVTAVILLGFFGSMGGQRQEMAWTQGYIAGQQAALAGEEAIQTAPPQFGPARPYARHGFGLFLFPLFGLMLFCLVPLFLLGGAFFFIGGRHRKHWHCGGNGRQPEHGWGPPWRQGNPADEPEEKSPEDIA